MRICMLTAILIFSLLVCVVPVYAQDPPVSADISINRVTLDFERLSDLQPITNQFANFGVTFVGATVLGQGSSLNYLHFPPHSGVNVIYDEPVYSGRITVTFDPNVAQNVTLVGAYVTGNRNITMTAYDAANSVLGSAQTGGANSAPEGVPNKLLQINASRAIKTVIFFNGGERGNTYTVDDFFFEGGLACQVNGVPLYKQGGASAWADDLYGGSESQPWYDLPGHQALVRDWGCAMTSAAMVVSYYGSLQGKGAATPRELNNWLRRHGGYSGGLILWPKVAEFARAEKGIDLYYYEGWGPDSGIVNAYVCNSAPIILKTTSSPYTSGHYVVGTGVSDSTAWTVNDPGGWNISTLRSDSYNSYRKYGSVQKEPKQLTIAIHPPNAPLIASVGANAAVSILITDPAGRRLRYNAISGAFENQILDANFAMEKLGAQDGSGRSIEAYVFGTGAPLDGEYQVQITSHVAGSYQLDLLGYDSSGQSSSVSSAGYAPSGAEIDLGVGYSSTPGSDLDVTAEWPQPGRVYLPLVIRQQPKVNAIQNGDFEQGAGAGWSQYSAQGWPLIMDINSLPVSPYSGVWAAWLGGDHDEISVLWQQLRVPTQYTTLQFRYWIASEDFCGYDYGGVIIDGTVVDVFDLCDSTDTYGWVMRMVNLAQYAGQIVTLDIRAETDSSINSNLFVDNVELGNALTVSQNTLVEEGWGSGVIPYRRSSVEKISSMDDGRTISDIESLQRLLPQRAKP